MKKIFYILLAAVCLMPFSASSQTVHSVSDTSYNADLSIAYYYNVTVVSEEGKNTITVNITEGTSSLGEIFDMDLYRDSDARFKDRPRIAKQIQVPANGVFIFEDEHATWTDDGGGLYGFTGSGTLPANEPMFYSIKINREAAFGGASRPRRSYPAIYLPNPPADVIPDMLNEDMTLVTQVFPNNDDTTAIIKLDFAPDYKYFQQVLAEALPGEPLYPAGDKLIFYGKVYLNNIPDPNGRTDIQYGNLYWGYEGSAYAKIKVDAQMLDSDNTAYMWLTSGRPGHSTMIPIPIRFELEGGSGGQTVHSVVDTAFNADQSIAYLVNATVISEEGKNTITFNISEGTSAIGEVFDMDIYRDTDARFKDRPRIAKQVQLPSNGTFVFVDDHATWTDDGGGLFGFTGSGTLPANEPYFYSIKINREEVFGGAARPRRSYPAIYLPSPPARVVQDVLDDNMTLVTQVFPNPEDSTVILKLDFAPDYSYFQQVLAEALPGEPLYPAGDKLIFYGKTYLNNMPDPAGRTDIQYGNLYWGYEGSAYAKIKVDESFLDDSGVTYAWFKDGRPGTATVAPIPIELFGTVSTEDLDNPLAFHVYPNPTPGLINVELTGDAHMINVYDLSGQVVRSQRLDKQHNGNIQMDLTDNPTGVYLLQVVSKTRIVTQKIILE